MLYVTLGESSEFFFMSHLFFFYQQEDIFLTCYMYLIYHSKKAIIVKVFIISDKMYIKYALQSKWLAWCTANYVTYIILWDIYLGYFVTKQNICLSVPRECTFQILLLYPKPKAHPLNRELRCEP